MPMVRRQSGSPSTTEERAACDSLPTLTFRFASHDITLPYLVAAKGVELPKTGPRLRMLVHFFSSPDVRTVPPRRLQPVLGRKPKGQCHFGENGGECRGKEVEDRLQHLSVESPLRYGCWTEFGLEAGISPLRFPVPGLPKGKYHFGGDWRRMPWNGSRGHLQHLSVGSSLRLWVLEKVWPESRDTASALPGVRLPKIAMLNIRDTTIERILGDQEGFGIFMPNGKERRGTTFGLRWPQRRGQTWWNVG
ncbi:hypothetical protein BKA62DRAFT_790910 [Auriculariales sp. MPI-PUGE-AT-0066]|nr:hypothetical protein BKA62DRAFT_790910 [Auriculariales sp. MPI-PUGE-AT-0066]